jgi:hypothetical protein
MCLARAGANACTAAAVRAAARPRSMLYRLLKHTCLNCHHFKMGRNEVRVYRVCTPPHLRIDLQKAGS